MIEHRTEICIVGAGIAGMVAALDLLDGGKNVILVDRDKKENFGGLAKWAFGGMFFVDTKHQRKNGIQDSIDLALEDWYSYAEFDDTEYWGKKWAEQYVHTCTAQGYKWLQNHGLKFFRVLNWVERGLDGSGNSVPRFHLTWGTGWEMVKVIAQKIRSHPKRSKLKLLFEHRVTDLLQSSNQIRGVQGKEESLGKPFIIQAEQTIIATGGINGSIEKVRANWPKAWPDAPKVILNGAHPYAIGDMHDAAASASAAVVHLDKQWNYAAGIPHYNARHQDHGLSLVPCKSALWLNARGKRIGPRPLVTGYDTRFLVEQICRQEHQYSWQILNRKIALKEFAISGSEHNEAIRDKKLLAFVKNVLLGNKHLVQKIQNNCPDFIVANDLDELVAKMNQLNNPVEVDVNLLRSAIEQYDLSIQAGPPYQDEQIKMILNARKWKGDKVRTCNLQQILDKKAKPLIAIRNFILSRKSLGGIQTDLQCRVLNEAQRHELQKPIAGLYAIGEAAGFGGGGIHGKRSLEGTFLGACVITARIAAAHINGQRLS